MSEKQKQTEAHIVICAISQGIVAMTFRCGGICDYDLLKLANIWQSYG